MGEERGVLEVITNWEREVREEIQRIRWRMESPVRKNGQNKRVPYIMELPPKEKVEGSGYELIENKEGVGNEEREGEIVEGIRKLRLKREVGEMKEDMVVMKNKMSKL